MNHYELLTIVSGKFAEGELESVTGKIDDLLKKNGCAIHYTQHMGRRKLAYPIKHLHYGYYVVHEFDGSPEIVKKIDRELGLSADLLRHLITKRDEVGAPKQFHARPEAEARTKSEIPAELRDVFASEPDAATPATAEQASDAAAVTREETSPVATEESDAAPAMSVPAAPTHDDASTDQPITAAAPSTTVDEERLETAEAQTPAAAVAAPEESGVAVATKEAEASDESATDTAPKKKKDERVSYEDLDKKLDEILKDDIL